MIVLQLIKDINSRRKERPVFETTLSSASTSTSRTTIPLSSLSALTNANQANYHTYYKLTNFHITQNANSSSNVKTATASGYTFQSV